MDNICSEHIYIKASPQIVWETVLAQRKHYKTIIVPLAGKPVTQYHLIETFPTPLGDATIKFAIEDKPFERVDFTMLESPCVKGVSGYWKFVKTEVGCQLFLVVFDVKVTAMPVPRMLVKAVLGQMVRHRLKIIRKMAEEMQVGVKPSRKLSALDVQKAAILFGCNQETCEKLVE